MSCPEPYLNKKIDIKSSVKNNEFFSSNVVNDWTFKNFVIWTGDIYAKRMKSHLKEYHNSLNSLLKKQNMDRALVQYVTSLLNKKWSDHELNLLREEFNEKPIIGGSINITNSVVNHSNITNSPSVSLRQTKRRRSSLPPSGSVVSVKKNKETYSLIKPTTPNALFSLDSPFFDEDIKAKVAEIAHIKISNECICQDQSLVNEYLKNVEESKAKSCMKRLPNAMAFLSGALNQNVNTLIAWLGKNGFESNHSEEEDKAILFIRLVLTDFYANCMKPPLLNKANERTPFVEYLVPIFKYYSAVYQNINFQWCEKGLDGNKCLKYFDLEDQGKKRLADGIGYVVADNTESMLIESSGEENDEHRKGDTIKLLECSIRALKMEMEKMKSSSFTTYKKRKFISYLYARDKLTMLVTSVVDKDHWGFVHVRDALIPRTWETRLRWLKLFDLMLCTKDKLEEQRIIAEMLEKEEDGWIEVSEGDSIQDMLNF
ncbi:uncharacterized protein EV154DRAFT_304183 [Mucor mucedo]|uniref:uncharacterized protein n=1 Tax=Mucor mucedo TaxID=29922 RepID=UPI0022206900|nr:uncharacterized protein EV154DRAFT_304183 [Mucor mucedo]KAI7888701.1 hypothetical protein EV154DRAFT_304183 [Mucor mucedo]